MKGSGRMGTCLYDINLSTSFGYNEKKMESAAESTETPLKTLQSPYQ
jgi:hypothetical protein